MLASGSHHTNMFLNDCLPGRESGEREGVSVGHGGFGDWIEDTGFATSDLEKEILAVWRLKVGWC
jgi:hypothetical protein